MVQQRCRHNSDVGAPNSPAQWSCSIHKNEKLCLYNTEHYMADETVISIRPIVDINFCFYIVPI